jgi:hypothetical protein
MGQGRTAHLQVSIVEQHGATRRLPRPVWLRNG